MTLTAMQCLARILKIRFHEYVSFQREVCFKIQNWPGNHREQRRAADFLYNDIKPLNILDALVGTNATYLKTPIGINSAQDCTMARK